MLPDDGPMPSNICKLIRCAAQQNYAGGGGGGLMSGGGQNGGGGGWQHDLQHLWNTLLGQLPSTTQPLLKAVRAYSPRSARQAVFNICACIIARQSTIPATLVASNRDGDPCVPRGPSAVLLRIQCKQHSAWGRSGVVVTACSNVREVCSLSPPGAGRAGAGGGAHGGHHQPGPGPDPRRLQVTYASGSYTAGREKNMAADAAQC